MQRSKLVELLVEQRSALVEVGIFCEEFLQEREWPEVQFAGFGDARCGVNFGLVLGCEVATHLLALAVFSRDFLARECGWSVALRSFAPWLGL